MYRVVKRLTDDERPKEVPVVPMPQCAMVNPGTAEEWEAYHNAAAAYYYGVVLEEDK